MPGAPNLLSLAEAAARIRNGDLTSEALVAACLERIAAREDAVGAWVGPVGAERAMAAARADSTRASSGESSSPGVTAIETDGARSMPDMCSIIIIALSSESVLPDR